MLEKKILVVGDNQDAVANLSDKFRVHGFDVAEANDGSEALKKIDSERPELMLLDLMMPGLDGTKLFQKLREGHTGKDTQVIFISAISEPGSESGTGSSQANRQPYSKQYDFPRLLSVVRAMI